MLMGYLKVEKLFFLVSAKELGPLMTESALLRGHKLLPVME